MIELCSNSCMQWPIKLAAPVVELYSAPSLPIVGEVGGVLSQSASTDVMRMYTGYW